MAKDKIKPRGKIKRKLEGDRPSDRLRRAVLDKASKRTKLKSTSLTKTMKSAAAAVQAGEFTKPRNTRNSGGLERGDGDHKPRVSRSQGEPGARLTRASTGPSSTPTVVKVELSSDDEGTGQTPMRVTRRRSSTSSANAGPSPSPSPRIVKRATRLLLAKPSTPSTSTSSQQSFRASATTAGGVGEDLDELTICIPELRVEELWNLLNPENQIPLQSKYTEVKVKTISSRSDSVDSVPISTSSEGLTTTTANSSAPAAQKFVCSKCSLTFPLRRSLQVHTKSKHGDGEPSSNAAATNDQVVNPPYKSSTDTETGLPCSACPRRFPTGKALCTHLWHKHKIKSSVRDLDEGANKTQTPNQGQDRREFRCQKCARTFPLRKALVVHIQREHGFMGASTSTSKPKAPERSSKSESGKAKVELEITKSNPKRVPKLCIRRLTSKEIMSFKSKSKGTTTPKTEAKMSIVIDAIKEKKVLKLCLRRLSETDDWISYNQRRSRKRERSPSSEEEKQEICDEKDQSDEDHEERKSSRKLAKKRKKARAKRVPTRVFDVKDSSSSEDSEEDTPSVPLPPRPKKSLTKQFTCNFCGHIANSFKNLESHIFSHTGERPHSCRSLECTSDFISEEEKLDHEKEFHPELFEYQCNPCHLGFETREEFTSHMIAIRHPDPEPDVEEEEIVENFQTTPSASPGSPVTSDIEPQDKDEQPSTPEDPNPEPVVMVKPKPPSQLLTCPHCPRTFQLNIAFQTHLRQMHDNPSASTASASTSVTPVVGEDMDIPTISIPEPTPLIETSFSCSACPKKYSLRRSLLIHIRKTHKHRADYLIGEFLEKERILKPPQPSPGSGVIHPFRCSKCPKSFQLRKGLQVHTMLVHKEKEVCPTGKAKNKTVSVAEAETVEMEVEPRRNVVLQFTCPQPNCNMEFVYRKSLHSHLSLAHGITCTDCASICSRPRDSSGQGMEFRCPKCPKSFSSQQFLRFHLIEDHARVENVKTKESAVVHPSTRSNPSDVIPHYECSECHMIFSTSSELAKHSESHAKIIFYGNRDSREFAPPSICRQCGQGFERAEELALHQLNHARGTVATYQYAKEGSTHRYLFTVHDGPGPQQSQVGSFNQQQQSQVPPIRNQSFPNSFEQHNQVNFPQTRNEPPPIRIVEAYSLVPKAAQSTDAVQTPGNDNKRHQVKVQVSGRSPPTPYLGTANPDKPIVGGQSNLTQVPGGTPVFACSYCPMKFFTQKFLDHHAKIHPKVYSCPHCPLTFKFTSSLELHQRIHNKTQIAFACLECPAQYGSEEALAIHQICHQPRVDCWKCSVCTKFFATSAQLALHEQLDHAKGHGQVQQNQIQMHAAPETMMAVLPSTRLEMNRWETGLSTTTPTPAVVNQTQNDGTTLFCIHCQKPYQHATALAAHVRLHTGERPFACIHCPLKFRSKRNLRNHNEKRHTHLEQSPNMGEDEVEFVNYDGDDMVNFEEEETVGMITLPPENCIMLPTSVNLNNMKYEGEPDDEMEMAMENRNDNDNQCESSEADFTLPLVPHVEMEIGNSQETADLNIAVGSMDLQPQPMVNFQDFVAPDLADGIPTFQDLISEDEGQGQGTGQNELVPRDGQQLPQLELMPIPNLADTTITSTPVPISSNGNDDFLLGL